MKRKSWRARYYELRAELASVRDELITVQNELFNRDERARIGRMEARYDLSAYDRCASEVTRAERELFEASPGYRRYQQEREDRERRGTGDWRLKGGDWRLP